MYLFLFNFVVFFLSFLPFHFVATEFFLVNKDIHKAPRHIIVVGNIIIIINVKHHITNSM